MERVKLYCRGECRGEIVLEPEGPRRSVRAFMPDPGDGLYRAVLRGERGEMMLGVLAPEGDRLELCRTIYGRDIERLGPLLNGEARCSFQFQETGWRETCCPAQLFRAAFFRAACAPPAGPGGGGSPCSVWPEWSGWRDSGAWSTPSGRRSQYLIEKIFKTGIFCGDYVL